MLGLPLVLSLGLELGMKGEVGVVVEAGLLGRGDDGDVGDGPSDCLRLAKNLLMKVFFIIFYYGEGREAK